MQSAVNWISDDWLLMQILTVSEAIVPRSSHSSEAVDPLISCHEIGCAGVLSLINSSEGEVSIVGESNGRLVN